MRIIHHRIKTRTHYISKSIKFYNMKRIIFILILGLAPWLGFAQHPAPVNTNNTIDSFQNDTINDHGEAGGIDPNEIVSNNSETPSSVPVWVWFGLGLSLIAGFLGGMYLNKGKDKKKEEEETSSKIFIDERVEMKSGSKEISPADVKKLKEEIKSLRTKVEEAKNEAAAYKKNIDIYVDFDQKYFNEAFRKLVSPMNDAMEKGSRKEIIENLLKMMSHYSSLTRYKISKKQPYDEANMQYLMNQKIKNDVAIEIDRNTPIDKIPKNIKTLTDLLSEQSSNGLDESIISGYKIKNI